LHSAIADCNAHAGQRLVRDAGASDLRCLQDSLWTTAFTDACPSLNRGRGTRVSGKQREGLLTLGESDRRISIPSGRPHSSLTQSCSTLMAGNIRIFHKEYLS